jgi:hypothetical protein
MLNAEHVCVDMMEDDSVCLTTSITARVAYSRCIPYDSLVHMHVVARYINGRGKKV